ncbi:hypothetical protein V1506DRAFT_580075 [Lipomyces tetrasporus]
MSIYPTELLLYGSTEITVLPTNPTLKSIRLDLRQAKVTGAFVNGKTAIWDYEDFWAATSSSPFKESARTIHQYNQFEDRLAPVIDENLSGELVVHFPRGVKVVQQDPFASSLNLGISPSLSRHESPEIAATPSLARTDLYNAFVPITVRVEFRLEDPAMGLHFVKKNAQHRYEHVYTISNPYGVSTSSWLPCVDGLWERCSWEFEITVPKSIGDIKRAQANGIDQDKDEEDSERDIAVVCIGDLHQEATHAFDHSKKTASFVLTSPVAAQHVGFAIGPFVQTNLSELKESDEDDGHHSSSSMEVYAYALPGRQDDVVNTCMFIHKAMEFFVREYSSYPFGSFSLCFVEDALDDMEPCCGLAIVSERHLFPGDIIDQIYPVTKYLTTLLAAQWSSVNIVPKNWNSLWITIGICRYITAMFLRKLMGNNEYRFRLKKDAEQICDLDIGRPPIGRPDLEFPVDKSTLDFIALKAPVILHILDRRLTKSGGSFGLTRVIPKIFWQAMSGDLTNGCLSTSHFQRLCEKVSHTKLDSFFQEWVLGSGYPIFRITQRFNKKKMFIEMGIRQVQNVEMPKTGALREESFVKDAKRHLQGSDMLESTVRPIFTGPMTIRIHEADGTPYEHVVNIKDSFTKLDIQYNTKYKRLKRHLRSRDKPSANAAVVSAATSGEPIDEGELDGVLLHSLGDVLSSENDMEEWRLREWTKEEEDQMTNEAFEWLRVDSDFEWICVIYINQPDYMYASQLQQDRDVVAQYECIRYFADTKPSPIYSTILVRTLMDRRYYYGIRIEAALTLAKYALPELDWIGRYHLLKAFQLMFCFPDSLIPQANDFSDFPTYYLQKTIPLALSEIRDVTGQTPMPIKEFLLDLLRYNENSHNTFSDCYYVGVLMTAICNSISEPPEQVPQFNFDFSFDVKANGTNGTHNKSAEAKFVEKAMVEIERCQRMDLWMPSYQKVVSTIALSIKEKLSQLGTIEASVSDWLQFTQCGLFDTLRLSAFSAILSVPDIYSAQEQKAVLRYVSKTILTDQSYYVRLGLIKLLGESLGKISMHKYGWSGRVGGGVGTFMIVEETGGEITESRKDEYRRSNLEGCIEIVKEQFSEVETLKRGFWDMLTSSALGILEKRIVLDICGILYDVLPTRLVKLRIPDQTQIVAKNLGHGNVKIYRTDKPRLPIQSAVTVDNQRSSDPGTDTESKTVTLPLPPNRIKLNIKIR